MEKHSVARLIGAPPGYVGYEEGGALTEAVRRRPYQVILFDEIEKAHPDVFNVLLQVLDDGRLTDGQGRTVDFRNTLIIMTSNLGSEYLVNQPEGEDSDAVREQVMDVVRGHFRPEFLNRVDEIILFHRLKRDQMTRIVDIQMQRLRSCSPTARSRSQLDDKAREWLGDKGYDPAYGARPLKRVIQKYVQDPLAEQLLAGKIHDGETVKISAGKDGLVINGVAVKQGGLAWPSARHHDDRARHAGLQHCAGTSQFCSPPISRPRSAGLIGISVRATSPRSRSASLRAGFRGRAQFPRNLPILRCCRADGRCRRPPQLADPIRRGPLFRRPPRLRAALRVGIPVARTVVWGVAMLGIVLVLIGLI